MTQPYEVAEACIETNYYGAKRMVEAHIDLLQLSDSPRIVNVSSSMGKLEVSTEFIDYFVENLNLDQSGI